MFVQFTSILAQPSINPRKPKKSATHGQGNEGKRKKDDHQVHHDNPPLASSSPRLWASIQAPLL
ncbi:hypothetical protein LINPERHAP2_LOCUS31865 [Linum perenne]